MVLEGWRIGESLPAPRLRVDVQPDGWSRSVRAARADSESSEKGRVCRKFWGEFLPELHNRYSFWRSVDTPSKNPYMKFPSSRSGLKYSAAFCQPDGRFQLRAEAYIDTRDQESTKAVFDDLYRQKTRIEEKVGEELEWDRIDRKQASRISLYYPREIRVTDEERWPDARSWLVEAMGKMRDAFNPVLRELPDEPE